MATIKPIEGRTVHQIQSGQVIVDLCSVVKELVENGLDAGATSIEVRFKNQGLESIEVQDNGHGISPNNYETLALKHHTSKLSTYADLNTLQTFGFRGEALSSLCALSRFSVVTCLAEDAPKGTKLEFEQSGALKGQSVVAAQKGTTVTVENLFHNLPVRKRELERNIKREWTRVVNVLNQYACIQTGIKFTVSQQAGKGKKTVMFSTKGNTTTRENLANIFGAKTLVALIALDLHLELEPTSAPGQKWSTQEDAAKKDVRIVGHISRPAYGEGRQTPDRQMFYVNSRPCGLPQVAKAFNEAYKAYNASQSPFILANIELDTDMYDVNVSPDKRTILLHDQTRMLENLKTALTELFESQDHTVPLSNLPLQKQPAYRQLTLNRDESMASKAPSPQDLRKKASLYDDDDLESEAEEAEDTSSEEEEESNESPEFEQKGKAVSRESLATSTGSINLMSNWIDRKTGDRPETKHPNSNPPQHHLKGLSKGKSLLVEKFKKETELAEIAQKEQADPESSDSNDQSSQSLPSPHVPQRVADSNERISEVQRGTDSTWNQHDKAVEPEPGEEDEDPIPSLQSPAKHPPSIASRFSVKARSQRPGPEIATITIGDETTTSPIGSPAKRIRSIPPASLEGLVARSKLPSFGTSLSQRFAAAASAPQEDDEKDEQDEEEEEGEGEEEEVEEDDEEPKIDESHSKGLEKEGSLIDETRFRGSRGHTIFNTSTSMDLEASADDVEEPSECAKVLDEAEGERDIEGVEVPQKRDSFDGNNFLDEDDQKALEAARVRKAIKTAEDSVQPLSQENTQRAKSILRGAKKKDSTLDLVRNVETSISVIQSQMKALQNTLCRFELSTATAAEEDEGLESAHAEEKLSLTISKSDFSTMRIVGQFNLGFILATRTSDTTSTESPSGDDVFIIDQHASDEKYNFERLFATTILQSQRLVNPKRLELTAMEEELVIEHQDALTKNGFILSFDDSGESPVGSRCQLLSLPLSRETTFSLSDLEELLALLADAPPGSVPRPSKVRKMLAMRACRSSVMIGRTLTRGGMEKLVRHLGELDKPWNCPHGRPTMRHLCALGVWDSEGWRGDVVGQKSDEQQVDWGAWLHGEEGVDSSLDEDNDEQNGERSDLHGADGVDDQIENDGDSEYSGVEEIEKD